MFDIQLCYLFYILVGYLKVFGVPLRLIKISFLILFLFCNTNLSSQIMNHYWSTNFNSISSLLGGAVVAGMGDNTSIYYNPATRKYRHCKPICVLGFLWQTEMQDHEFVLYKVVWQFAGEK